MEKNRSIHGLSPCSLQMLRIMKLTVFLMLISFAGVFASESYSQTTKLTLKVEKISLEDFLIKIEDQSEFRFFYTGKSDSVMYSGEYRWCMSHTLLSIRVIMLNFQNTHGLL